jgi:micrococcal nuclease
LLRYIYQEDRFINGLLVKEGYARVFEKYRNDTKRYEQLKTEEKEVLENHQGVWGCSPPFQGCLYVGSKNSKTYHDPNCKYAKKIKPENLRCYHSEEEVKELKKSTCK